MKREHGSLAEALALFEEALEHARKSGDGSVIAQVFANIGRLLTQAGQYDRAEKRLRDALALYERIRTPPGIAETLRSLGYAGLHQGRPEPALALFRRAVVMLRSQGDLRELCEALTGVGEACQRLRKHAEALAAHEEALKLSRQAGFARGEQLSLVMASGCHREQGRHEPAFRLAREAERLARDQASVGSLLGALLLKGGLCHDLGRDAECVEIVEEAGKLGATMSGQLPEELSAGARRSLIRLVEEGTLSALRLDRIATAFRILEAGRASALARTLGGRERLRDTVLSEERREQERKLWMALRDAESRDRRSLVHGDPKEIVARRDALTRARSALTSWTEKIALEGNLAVRLVQDEPVPLKVVKGQLRPGEALVVYHVHTVAMAIVLTRDSARLVLLGDAEAVKSACETGVVRGARSAARGVAVPRDGSTDPRAGVARLAKLVVKPLRLEASIRRVIVAPHGPLARVPPGLLFGDREVVLVPSASTYIRLAAERTEVGRGVLAFGDPAYRTEPVEGAPVLARLPGSGRETRAVGTQVVLGDEATIPRFRREISSRKRWRAVHLAGHVLILSRDVFNARSGTVIAVALISQPQMAGFPLSLALPSKGLPKRSWVKISQIRTLAVERLGRKLGRATPEELGRVLEGLIEIVGA